MSLRAEAITDPARLEELSEAWDELAVDAALPFCAPGWLLPWWREAAPQGARLHAVAAFDGERLVALAPFFVDGDALLPLGCGANTRVEPLTRPGREADANRALAPLLAGSGAAVVRLSGIPKFSPWPELLAQAWPGGRAWLHEDERMPAPVAEVAGSFDEWLGSRSSRMRNHLRKYERLLRERDARVELAADAGAVAAFASLHRARWAGRGGSGVLDDRVERAVAAAATALPRGRFRLFTIDTAGGPVATAVFVAAGGEVNSWLGGFDDA